MQYHSPYGPVWGFDLISTGLYLDSGIMWGFSARDSFWDLGSTQNAELGAKDHADGDYNEDRGLDCMRTFIQSLATIQGLVMTDSFE